MSTVIPSESTVNLYKQNHKNRIKSAGAYRTEHAKPRLESATSMYEKDTAKEIKMPRGWVSNNIEPMTRTKLLERRVQERKPDMSLDIDGDGVVSNLDLFIGLKFDKDKDGKLN